MLCVNNQNRNYKATASRIPIKNEHIVWHMELEK